MIGIGLVNLGRLQAAMGDPESGRKALEESRTILRAAGQRRPESYALHRLGAVEEQTGNPDAARHLYDRALAMRREILYASGVAETLLALGRLRLAQGELEEARPLLAEAQTVARDIDRADENVLATVYLGDVAGAEEALDALGARMRIADRMEAHFALFKATRNTARLEEAHRLLSHIRDHAPEEYRDSLIEKVPLHREIAAAWAERGT